MEDSQFASLSEHLTKWRREYAELDVVRSKNPSRLQPYEISLKKFVPFGGEELLSCIEIKKSVVSKIR
jgi:hypothetical protein